MLCFISSQENSVRNYDSHCVVGETETRKTELSDVAQLGSGRAGIGAQVCLTLNSVPLTDVEIQNIHTEA